MYHQRSIQFSFETTPCTTHWLSSSWICLFLGQWNFLKISSSQRSRTPIFSSFCGTSAPILRPNGFKSMRGPSIAPWIFAKQWALRVPSYPIFGENCIARFYISQGWQNLCSMRKAWLKFKGIFELILRYDFVHAWHTIPLGHCLRISEEFSLCRPLDIH